MMKPTGMMVASSPGRDKLPVPAPPALARLLGGSRSRGRSAARSSPMFVSRSRSVGRSAMAGSPTANAGTEGGEPSSPKVTCIGQVRMRNKRSSSKNKKAPPPSSKKEKRAPLMPCGCLHRAFICILFPARKKHKADGGGAWWSLCRNRSSLGSRSSRSRSCSVAGGGYQQRKLDPIKLPPEVIRRAEETDGDGAKREEEEEEEDKLEPEDETRVSVPASAATTPPKNALLLMRCRSAPHNRASALVGSARFAVSPLPAEEQSIEDSVEVQGSAEVREGEKRKSIGGGEGDAMTMAASAEEEEVEGIGSVSQRPLVLTRSKSEPARSAAAKLAVPPEAVATSCCWDDKSAGGWQRGWGLFHEERAPQTLLSLIN